MRYDYKTLYEKSAAFYRARPLAKKTLLTLNLALTGVFFFVYGGFVAYSVFTGLLTEELIKLLGLPALCLLIVGVLRLAVQRPRPYSKEGADITPLLQKSNPLDKSFPSRHVACAFVISTVLFPYSAWAGICLLLLSGALGYIRFALGLHYPSDLIGGALIGAACGLLTFAL